MSASPAAASKRKQSARQSGSDKPRATDSFDFSHSIFLLRANLEPTERLRNVRYYLEAYGNWSYCTIYRVLLRSYCRGITELTHLCRHHMWIENLIVRDLTRTNVGGVLGNTFVRTEILLMPISGAILLWSVWESYSKYYRYTRAYTNIQTTTVLVLILRLCTIMVRTPTTTYDCLRLRTMYIRTYTKS